jgi:TRAP transporter TAXI family solute receptor
MTPGPTDDPAREQRLNELLAEYFRMAESGEAPDDGAFLAQHPDFAGELKEFFADKEWFNRWAESLQPPQRTISMPPQAGSQDRPPPDRADIPPTAPLGTATLSAGLRGRRFGDYDLLEEIASGGMGVVYRARQRSLNRIVALKMILAGQLASRVEVERFQREARAAANLRHRNIVMVHEVGEEEGQHYFSMDFIEGKNLAEIVRPGPLPAQQAARYMKKIAEAIHYAHQQGTLHRDLKPANALVDRDDEPMITDFGLAKRREDDSRLTHARDILGTPSYMSPEQASGDWDKVGAASDIYSLGAMLYELLTGRPPFRAESPTETVLQVLSEEPTSPRRLNPKVPRDLETIALKCLEKDPARRYPTALALAEDLGRFLEGEPIRAKPVGILARSLHFVRGIPLVAVLTGREMARPTRWQKRIQRAINAIPLVVAAAAAIWYVVPLLLPSPIRIAGGTRGAAYLAVAERLAALVRGEGQSDASAVETEGSVENLKLLLEGKAEFGVVDESNGPFAGDQIRIVTHLFDTKTYVVVRKGSGIGSLDDLRDKLVWIAPEGSGMRSIALGILEGYGIKLKDFRPSTVPFAGIFRHGGPDAAIVTTKWELSRGLQDGLSSGQFALLPIEHGLPDDLAHVLDPSEIGPKELPPAWGLSKGPIRTVKMRVYLAGRAAVSGRLVAKVLSGLYDNTEAWQDMGLIAEEQLDLRLLEGRMHPAARDFFLKRPDKPAGRAAR